MTTIKRTTSDDKIFLQLVEKLNAELAIRDGDEHAFYNQYNKLDTIKNVVLIYENGEPFGCGAFKKYSEDTAEMKRMYVQLDSRGKGIGGKILTELETWAKELGYKKSILETGIRQPEAIALYKKSGYKIIGNYGQYLNAANSVCFEKKI